MAASGERRNDSLLWDRDGSDWPNRDASRFVEAAGLTWHVQIMGDGPVLLLIHGTGASTHSWRDLAPLLAEDFTVVAPDLPGHAFTRTPSREQMSLSGMASALAALMQAIGLKPKLVAGHSAGAAIMTQMTLDRSIAPVGLVGLNGAMVPIGGAAGRALSPVAKLVAQSSLVPRLFAWRAGDAAVIERLIKQTGSTLDPAGLALYGRLARNPIHAAAALGMMAQWDLWTLERSLSRLDRPLVLIVGGSDGTISPSDAFRIRDLVPTATVEYLRGLGHLAHEERPDTIADLVLRYARRWHVLA